MSILVSAPQNLGDWAEDDTIHFLWHTSAAAGGRITRAVAGTVAVYKDNGATQSTAGITDTEDFDSGDTTAGFQACTIDLSADAFYSTGSNFSVVLTGATIDGVANVNAVLAWFSIENGVLFNAAPAEITSMPAVNTNPIAMLKTLFTFLRNKRTQTSTTATLRNDADDADIATSTVSDDATTNTRGEWT